MGKFTYISTSNNRITSFFGSRLKTIQRLGTKIHKNANLSINARFPKKKNYYYSLNLKTSRTFDAFPDFGSYRYVR